MLRGGTCAVSTDCIVFLTEVNITSRFLRCSSAFYEMAQWDLTQKQERAVSRTPSLRFSLALSSLRPLSRLPLHKKGKQSDRTHVCGNFHDYARKNVPLWLDFKQMLCAKFWLVYQWGCQRGFCGWLLRWDKNLTWESLKKLLALCLWHRNNPHTGPNLPWCHSPCFLIFITVRERTSILFLVIVIIFPRCHRSQEHEVWHLETPIDWTYGLY